MPLLDQIALAVSLYSVYFILDWVIVSERFERLKNPNDIIGKDIHKLMKLMHAYIHGFGVYFVTGDVVSALLFMVVNFFSRYYLIPNGDNEHTNQIVKYQCVNISILLIIAVTVIYNTYI